MTSGVPEKIACERRRRLRLRNWVLFAMLGGFVVLVYAITIVKITLGYGP